MQFLPDDPVKLLQAVIAGLICYVAILLVVRLLGLRSFAKMASHDFAVTVAIGSILASSAMATGTAIIVPLLAVATLFVAQYVMSLLLRNSDAFANATQNTPVLLMRGEEIFHDNLARVRVSEDELYSKLRTANVTRLSQVKAVILETTGDVSVLHGSPDEELDAILLTNVDHGSASRHDSQ